jgi:hypothetical protein
VNLRANIRKATLEIKDGSKGWLVLLVFAATVHLATTAAVFVVGRTALMPAQFNRNGLGAFASDSFFYQEDLVSLTDKLRNEGVVTWIKAVAPLHVKFYSVSYFLFSRWAGPNVLTIEPLNLLYYLTILWLIYKIAEMVFNRWTGLLSMAVMAIWPSFLMHTTQLIRDPLLIVAILVLILAITNWLIKDAAFVWNLAAAVPAVLAVLTIWIVRLAMWDAVRVVVAAAFILLVVRHLRERRVFAGHVLNAIVLIAAIMFIPQSQSVKSQQRREVDVGRPMLAERVAQLTIWQRIGKRRQAFANVKKVESSSTVSNIDAEVQFNTMGDFVRYLPRAAALGFFAPFPNMWFQRGGQVGRTGRMIAGLETLITYVLEILALIGLWHMRKSLAAWLLAGTAIAGMTGLGLIVLNIGSLYRFRYPFLMLIVMLAASGTIRILQARAARKASLDAV